MILDLSYASIAKQDVKISIRQSFTGNDCYWVVIGRFTITLGNRMSFFSPSAAKELMNAFSFHGALA
ncbi:hypothetical protein GYMLUDRAFT_36650 [Collybiopsis luxurians FD-317 M1]|nr:hypothetical protein GYMLUDRAFT_36650 [Collybiopsis luxurians FD-317 M1]